MFTLKTKVSTAPHWRWLAFTAALPAVVLCMVLLAPTARIVLEGFGFFGDAQGVDWPSPWHIFTDPYLRWRLLWTGLQAALTCGLTLLLGVPIAWVLARLEFAGRGLMLRTLMLPFVVPTLVAGMGILAVWGPRGVAQQYLGVSLQDSPVLLLLGNVFFNLCIVVRAGVDGLGAVNARQVDAARTLGASAWRTFWRVEWPVMLPWLLAGLCLVFLFCFSSFGLALILGGQQYATLEVEIYTLVAHELKLAQASVLSLWSMLLTAVVALAYAAIERNLATPQQLRRVLRGRPSPSQWLAVAGAVLALTVLCFMPLAAIAVRAVGANMQVWALLQEAQATTALWNSLRFTAIAVVLATVLGLSHALTARRSLVWRTAVYVPFIVSPITVGFGVLLLYPQWSASMVLLVVAYAVLAYPFVAKAVLAALDKQPPNLSDAARTLGASPARTFWRVRLPLLSPALRSGMAFAAATAMGEFAVTLFLSRPEWATLTTLIYQFLGRPGAQNMDAAMVLACVLMLLSLLCFIAIEWRTPFDKQQEHTHA